VYKSDENDDLFDLFDLFDLSGLSFIHQKLRMKLSASRVRMANQGNLREPLLTNSNRANANVSLPGTANTSGANTSGANTSGANTSGANMPSRGNGYIALNGANTPAANTQVSLPKNANWMNAPVGENAYMASTSLFGRMIYKAIDDDNLTMFKDIVNSDNINEYFDIKGDLYTPILYLARKVPQHSKDMLEHCFELNADPTLKAQTKDCLGIFQSKKCTTIGNLAAYNQSKITLRNFPVGANRIRHYRKMVNGKAIFNTTKKIITKYGGYEVYMLLVSINKGLPVFTSETANTNAAQWKGKIPGVSAMNEARRTARFIGKTAPLSIPLGAIEGTFQAIDYATGQAKARPTSYGGRRRRTRRTRVSRR